MRTRNTCVCARMRESYIQKTCLSSHILPNKQKSFCVLALMRWEDSLAVKNSLPNPTGDPTSAAAGAALQLSRAPSRRVVAATRSARASAFAAACGSASSAYRTAACRQLHHRHVLHVLLTRPVARVGGAQHRRMRGLALSAATRAPWRRLADRPTLRLLCSVPPLKIPRVLRRPPRPMRVTPHWGAQVALECAKATQQRANARRQAFAGLAQNRESPADESGWLLSKFFGARCRVRKPRSRGPATRRDAASKNARGLTASARGTQ
jgi:hypothetical protein